MYVILCTDNNPLKILTFDQLNDHSYRNEEIILKADIKVVHPRSPGDKKYTNIRFSNKRYYSN